MPGDHRRWPVDSEGNVIGDEIRASRRRFREFTRADRIQFIVRYIYNRFLSRVVTETCSRSDAVKFDPTIAQREACR